MIGFSVQSITRRVSQELVNRSRKVPVANLSDCMSRLTAAGPRLRPYHEAGQMTGPAFTVKCRPGDNLMVHKALDMALAGDVIVVDAGGELTNSIIGEMMVTYARTRGLGGFVINGSIRDAGALRRQGFPVFAAGITHRGPNRSGPGEIGRAIAIDGMIVAPGDLVIGDDDGVLSIPFDEVEKVLVAAESKRDSETKALEDMIAGKPVDRAWVDDTLKKLGCEFRS